MALDRLTLECLSPKDKLFVSEAEEGGFLVDTDEDSGRPFALGAKGTSNLFSMRVEEKDDPHSGGSIYFIPE